MRFVALLILLCLSDISFTQYRYAFGQAVWNGYTYNAPVCNKPNCAMCNAIRAQLAAQQAPVPTVQNTTTTYETRAVTKQVKRCNGRTCWYETVTEYIQVPVQTKPVTPYNHRDDEGRLWQWENPNTKVSLRNNVLPKKDISLDLVPTPDDAIPILVSLLRPGPNDIFIEPGCGDGRVLKAVSKFCISIGIELNKDTAKIAKDKVGSDAIVIVGDATEADYTRATIVSMYLYPNVMEKIVPLLQPGTRIVSYCHTIPGIKCSEHTTNGHTFYVGVK